MIILIRKKLSYNEKKTLIAREKLWPWSISPSLLCTGGNKELFLACCIY